MFFNSPFIYYLEKDDVQNGVLTSDKINSFTNRPFFSKISIVMIQGNFCGFCTQVKPYFEKLAAELHPYFDFMTIQTDGNDGFDAALFRQVLGQELQGVPMFVKFYQGKVIPNSEFQGERNYNELKQWMITN